MDNQAPAEVAQTSGVPHKRQVQDFTGKRVTYRCDSPMDIVMNRLRENMGNMSIAKVIELAQQAGTLEAYEEAVRSYIPETGFVIFEEIDHGAWLKRYGLNEKSIRLIFGNALLAVTMIRQDPVAGLFVPLEMIITENADHEGCAITYITSSSQMVIEEYPDLLKTVLGLDAKVAALFETVLG